MSRVGYHLDASGTQGHRRHVFLVVLLMCFVTALGCRQQEEAPRLSEAAPSSSPLPRPELMLSQDPSTGEWRQAARYCLGPPAVDHYRTDERPETGDKGWAELVRGAASELHPSSCLARAAAAYARFHPHGAEVAPPRGVVEFALHWAGCADAAASVHLFYTTEDGIDGVRQHVEMLALSAGENTHIGVGRAPGGGEPYEWTWAIFLAERRFSLEAFPSVVDVGQTATLRLGLDEGFASPTLLIQRAGDRIDELDLSSNGDEWVADVRFEDAGSAWIEVFAEGRLGPTVIALFPVSVGGRRSEVWEGFIPPDESGLETNKDAERVMFALVNRVREERGLKALTLDPRLSAVARGHSEDMRDSDDFAHVSRLHGPLSRRLATAGYEVRASAENIARNPSIHDAHLGLMGSPGHRVNILSPDMSHVGIGVAESTGESGARSYFVTQDFARPVQRVSLDVLATRIEQALHQERVSVGLSPPRRLAVLDRIVEDAVHIVVASGFDTEKLNDRVGRALVDQEVAHRRFQLQYQEVLEPSDIEVPGVVQEARMGRYGLAVLAVPRRDGEPEVQATMILLVE